MKIVPKTTVQGPETAGETPRPATKPKPTPAPSFGNNAALALVGAAPAPSPVQRSSDGNVTTRLHRIASLGVAQTAQRFAAIDLGSSSVKMLIQERGEDGKMRTLHDEKIGCALGKDVPANGAIPQKNMQRAVDALKDLLKIADSFGVAPEAIPMITTAVVRNSTNGAAFADQVRKDLGLKQLKILSGPEEAERGYKGAIAMMNGAPGRYATLDLGGGSFQLAIGDEKTLEAGGSSQVGSNKIVQQLLPGEILSAKDFAAADALLLADKDAKMPLDVALLQGRTLVATGGISKFLRAHLGKDVISASEIDALRKSMGAIGFDARVPLIQAGKDADTLKALGVDTAPEARDYGVKLVASTTLLLHILNGIAASEVRVSETDSRHSLVLESAAS